MWDKSNANFKRYLLHLRRLLTSKDVMFSKYDLLPALMQPLLLASYSQICHDRGQALSEMFQSDVALASEFL